MGTVTLTTGTSSNVYLTTNPPAPVVLPSGTALNAAILTAITQLGLVPYGTIPPDHTRTPVYVDTSTTPPVLKGWNGTFWAPIGGGGSTLGGPGFEHVQASPAGTWTISHTLGRRPDVDIYSLAGELLFADVIADATQAVITFAVPTAGTAVLT